MSNTKYISVFEQQKEYFNDFVDEFQDRLNLLISDGIEIIFDKTFVQLNDIIVINFSKRTLMVELFLKEKVYKTKDIQILKNVVDNFDEISSMFKKYLLIFNHLSQFKNFATSDNEYYALIRDGLKDIQVNDPFSLNGKIFYLLESEYNNHNYKIYVKIDSFGSIKKKCADISYILEDTETNEQQFVCRYSIPKDQFAEDLGYQLAYKKCTHLVDINE